MKSLHIKSILASAALGIAALVPQGCIAQNYGYNDGYNNEYNNQYDNGNISLQTFYQELAPYGTWFQDPQYGYVWRPDAARQGFRPYYTNGRWAMTEYGNTWISDYEWGWAPFHYGSWILDRYNQWLWIPGTQWAPAWVDWRYGDGYYGWAPMGPSLSVNINLGRSYSLPLIAWTFVSGRSLYNRWNSPYNYNNARIYNRTTIINNYYGSGYSRYNRGPGMSSVSRYYGNVPVYSIRHTNSRNQNGIYGNSVNIYRPSTIYENTRGASTQGNGSWSNNNPRDNRNTQGSINRPSGTVNSREWDFGNGRNNRTSASGTTQPVQNNTQGTASPWGNSRGSRNTSPSQPAQGNTQGTANPWGSRPNRGSSQPAATQAPQSSQPARTWQPSQSQQAPQRSQSSGRGSWGSAAQSTRSSSSERSTPASAPAQQQAPSGRSGRR